MPTNNPRLTITLEPLLAAQLRRLSELTGNSQSKLIAELLEGSTPVFERLIRVLEAAHAAKDVLRTSTVRDMEAAQTKLEAQFGLALETMDDATLPLLKQAEAITRRARKGRQAPVPSASGTALPSPPAAAATPLSNRGVRLTRKTTKTTTRTRG